MVKIYPIAPEVASKSGISVKLDGQELGLYDARVLFPPFKFVKAAPYGIFELDGEVQVEVTVPFVLEQVDIRPKSKGMTCTFDAHTVRFTLDKPTKISVEFNNSIENALALFAYAPENPDEIPSPEDENVKYFAPGVHDLGDYEIPSGQTVYLAGGAYVFGRMFTAEHSENIKILGRGVLDGLNTERNYPHRELEPYFTKNFLLQDITVTDANGWTVRVFGCDDVVIHDVNIFGYRGNSDGVDVCGSRNVEVYNMFIRNWDDALAVKAFDTGDMDNIYFHDCTIWTDFARPIEVGYEHRADEIKNVHYKNIDIIHSMSGYPLIGIHQGDRAYIHDVIFEDIRVEDALGGQFIDLRIKPSGWNRDSACGHVENVTFRNIYLNGKPGLDKLPEPSRIEGYSEQSDIKGVTFENVYISGKRVTSAEECRLNLLKHSNNVTFVPPTEEIPDEERLVPVESKLEILDKTLGDHGIYTVKAKVTLQNKDASHPASGNLWVEAYPKTEAEGLCEVWNYTLAAGECWEKEITFCLRAGKYFITTQSQYIDVKPSWLMLELAIPVPAMGCPCEFAALAEKNAMDIFTMEGVKIGSLAVAYQGEKLYLGGHISDLAVKNGALPAEDPALRYACLDIPVQESRVDIYASEHNAPVPGELAFLIAETGFGECTALQWEAEGPVLASELRNIAEITYVFKNQPKVDAIYHTAFTPTDASCGIACTPAGDGYDFSGAIPFEVLGIGAKTGKNFLLEFQVNAVAPGTGHFDRVPMFHAIRPEECVAMFGRFELQ